MPSDAESRAAFVDDHLARVVGIAEPDAITTNGVPRGRHNPVVRNRVQRILRIRPLQRPHRIERHAAVVDEDGCSTSIVGVDLVDLEVVGGQVGRVAGQSLDADEAASVDLDLVPDVQVGCVGEPAGGGVPDRCPSVESSTDSSASETSTMACLPE